MGGKRINLDSKFQPNKCVKRRHGDDDRISRLPDDILVVILSSLPLKEAALTSVLSSRWRDLWKHTSCLNFDADSALDKIAKQNDLRKQEEWQNVEMRKYVKWVNGVLQSHKALTLKEFRICFNLDRSSRKAITKWLEFAFSRQVQRLELEALYNGHSRGCESKNYVFPEELLRQNYVHPLRASDNSGIRYMQAHFDFKSIKALSLKGVKVAGEALEFFLRNCPLLEQLVVHCSEKVSNLEVCGSSLLLKHLEIVYCCDVKSIKVSAPNLSSLTVPLLKKGLVLENVPSLVEVSATCGAWNTSFKNFVPAFSCCLSRLEILTLFICDPKEITEVHDFPELPKLKKLEIEYLAKGDQSLLGLTSLIRASPYLQEFVVKSIWSELSRANREIKIDIQFSHQHLTVFKFLGYYGRTSDIELVRYISENCLVLEKIVIDPHYCQPGFTRGPIYYYQKEERTAIIYAKQLLQAEVVPRHIELVIL